MALVADDALHQLLCETEEVHILFDLDVPGDLVRSGHELEGITDFFNGRAGLGPGDTVIGGRVIVMLGEHGGVPVPLNSGADHLGGEAVAFHGQFHALDLDGAEVIFTFNKIGELWIASHGADSLRDEALLQINDKEMVHSVWRVEELHKIVIHEVRRVVALEALIFGCFRLIAGNVPLAGHLCR